MTDFNKEFISLWLFSHYTGEIWERSFISTVDMPAKFVIAQCQLMSTLMTVNPWQKRNFTKTLLKLEELENAGCVF